MERLLSFRRMRYIVACALLAAAAAVAILSGSDPNVASAVYCHPCEATEVTTSLSGEGQSGTTITVKEGAAVTDQATLGGPNASKAGGTMSYTVFSDPGCTSEVASAGTVAVTDGAVGPSEGKTLSPGTYYWRASYSGDSEDNPSESACNEVETVAKAEPPKCTRLVGEGTIGEKSEKIKLTNALSTNLNSKQKLAFSWEGGKERFKLQLLTRAVCKVGRRASTFSGTVLGTLNKEAGYSFVFKVKISNEGEVTLKAKVKKHTEVIEEFEEEFEESTEEIL